MPLVMAFLKCSSEAFQVTDLESFQYEFSHEFSCEKKFAKQSAKKKILCRALYWNEEFTT